MFTVECPGCKATYQVDERRVPAVGLRMRCPKCSTAFVVEKPQGAAESLAVSEAAELPAPAIAKPALSSPEGSLTRGVSPRAPSTLGRDAPVLKSDDAGLPASVAKQSPTQVAPNPFAPKPAPVAPKPAAPPVAPKPAPVAPKPAAPPVAPKPAPAVPKLAAAVAPKPAPTAPKPTPDAQRSAQAAPKRNAMGPMPVAPNATPGGVEPPIGAPPPVQQSPRRGLIRVEEEDLPQSVSTEGRTRTPGVTFGTQPARGGPDQGGSWESDGIDLPGLVTAGDADLPAFVGSDLP